MGKIVINACFGGFSLSDQALARYRELANPPKDWSEYDLDRQDPLLIQVVEELGKKANGDCAQLAIKELPQGTEFRIREYDGGEWIETPDSIEWEVVR